MTTITDHRIPCGHAISLAVWWVKLEKNDKGRHNITQIASLLVMATGFTRLMVCNSLVPRPFLLLLKGPGYKARSVMSAFYSQRGGAYT